MTQAQLSRDSASSALRGNMLWVWLNGCSDQILKKAAEAPACYSLHKISTTQNKVQLSNSAHTAKKILAWSKPLFTGCGSHGCREEMSTTSLELLHALMQWYTVISEGNYWFVLWVCSKGLPSNGKDWTEEETETILLQIPWGSACHQRGTTNEETAPAWWMDFLFHRGSCVHFTHSLW